MKNNIKKPSTENLKLCGFSHDKKLILILSTIILWTVALLVYNIPNFNHWFVASFNFLRANQLFTSLCYYYTKYMLYFIPTPMIILYLAAFKINTLNPYRMVLLLTVMTLAIGIPITDLLKLHYSVPRPWILYPDITHIYPVRGSCFPSGHAFQAFAGIIPLTLCLLKQKTFKKTVTAILLLIFAITLSFSRILAGMHFPSDILFAIGLATLLIPILASLLQWLIKTGKLNTQNEKWYSIIFTILITIAIIYL